MFALLAAALLFGVSPSGLMLPQDTPTVTVHLEPARARVGETVTLRIIVKSPRGGPIIEMPQLNSSLQSVGTSDYTEVNITPQGRSNTFTRDIVLLPQAPGQYSIPSIRVIIAGKPHLTAPLLLRVTGDAPSQEPYSAITDARLNVRMQPETVYVGQQSTLIGEVWLTPDLHMRLTRPPSYDAPAPSDFWIQALPPDPNTETRLVDGQRFIVQRFYGAYFPLTPGRYAFSPARVTYEARQGFLFAPQVRELRSASPRVTVLPIPEQGRPESFNGAVGTLSITSSVVPEQAAVGDAVSLVVEVSGTGNIKALPPPKLPKLDGADVLDPSETTEVTTDARIVRGTKRFTWVLVPEREGKLQLPPIEYASFDPEARTFRRHQTDPGDVDVTPTGAAGPTRLASLRRRPATEPLGWVRSTGFAAVQVVPVMLLGMAVVVRRRRSGLPTKLKRDWDSRLKALRAARANPLAHAERLLRDALAALWPSMRLHSGSPAELRTELARRTTPQFADQVARLVERIESARYAPEEPTVEEREAILNELRAVLDIAWTDGRATAGRLMVVPIALLMLQAPADSFQKGIDAYQAGQLEEAATQFERYVGSQKNDASGWYNLGVVYQSQRRSAHAAWALLHATRLEPRARSIDTQLRRLGASRLAERVRPLVPVTTNETLLIASVSWLLAGTLLALAVLRRSRKPALVALFPFALAGLLLLINGVERLLPPPAIVFEQGTPLLAGQSLHSDVVRHLQPLSGVTIVEEQGGWVRVRTNDGETGWVSSDGIGRL
jgi:hypothetical protein